MGLRVWGFVAVVGLAGAACAHSPARSKDRAARMRTFELVWARVRDKHYDPNMNGVDWGRVKREYAPRVKQARSDKEFYSLLERMLGELKQSHFGVIPPDAAQFESEEVSWEWGEPGLVIQLVEGRPVVTEVPKGSPAEKSGIRAGFVVTSIRGKSLDAVLARLKVRHRREMDLRTAFLIETLRLLHGPLERKVGIRFLNGDDRPGAVEVGRKRFGGELVELGEMPPMYAEMESRRLEGGAGYVRFNVFMMPLLGRIRDAITSMRDAPGIVLDLRRNPGGVGMMATPIAGMFVDKQISLGTMKMREGEMYFPVFPSERPYRGPLAILTDELSASTSEILAAGLQEAGRAVVVGRPTPGMALPSVVERLPGGVRLQYAVADFRTPKGKLLEGRGVIPDIPVELRRAELLAGKDPILEAAVAYILGRNP